MFYGYWLVPKAHIMYFNVWRCVRRLQMKILSAASRFALAVGLGLAIFPTAGQASTVYSVFSQNNSCGGSLGCSGAGIIAEAALTDVAGGVSVDIYILDAGFRFMQAGNPPMVDFQAAATGLSGTSAAMDSLTGTTTWALYGADNSGGPGSFNQSAGYAPKGPVPFSFDIVFTLAGVTTGAFVANASGYTMAVDMCRGVASDGGCLGTGFVGGKFTEHETPLVPLPGALPLFATGLGALGLLGWRRKRKAAAVAA
jgi:hypothetical protein